MKNDLLLFALNRIKDPLLIGELAGLELRVDQFVIDRQLEAAAAGGDQLQLLDLLLVRFQQLGRQTDGLRFVVSDGTVLKFEVHASSP